MSSHIHNCTAVVLDRVDNGERDAVITLLTTQHGKKVYGIRGIKHARSKQSASLVPGAAGYVWWTQGKRQDIIVSTQLVSPFVATTPYETVYALRVVTAFVNRALPLNVLEHRVFNTLLDMIQHIRQGNGIDAHAYIKALLSHLGWRADANVTDLASYIEHHLNVSAEYVRQFERATAYPS